jgi:hypothetical protein
VYVNEAHIHTFGSNSLKLYKEYERRGETERDTAHVGYQVIALFLSYQLFFLQDLSFLPQLNWFQGEPFLALPGFFDVITVDLRFRIEGWYGALFCCANSIGSLGIMMRELAVKTSGSCWPERGRWYNVILTGVP